MGICISNATIGMAKKAKKYPQTCTEIEGIMSDVVPIPCNLLRDQGLEKVGTCDFSQDSMAIDNIELQRCSQNMNSQM